MGVGCLQKVLRGFLVFFIAYFFNIVIFPSLVVYLEGIKCFIWLGGCLVELSL